MKLFYAFYDRAYGYARAIITLVVGIVLIIWPDVAVKTIIIVIGALVLAVGITNLILSYKGKWKDEKVPLLSMNGLVEIAFGLVLIIFPAFFAGIIMFLFGLLLLLFGGGALVNLIQTRRLTRFSWTLFIGPVLTLVCGVVVFLNPFAVQKWLFIFFGISLLIYSLSEFAATFNVRSILKKKQHEAEKERELLTEEVPFEEVKENDSNEQ